MVNRNRRLLFTLSILLVSGFVITSLASFQVSRASLRRQITHNELPLTSDNIYSEIQRDLLRPIFISSLMASDTFLRDWVLNGEQGTGAITKYLREIQERYGTFTSFFVSEKSRIYYQAGGILKKVSPDSWRDEWYFRVRDMDGEYEINVDPDLANKDAMTIFVNYRVYDYDGNYIGATGVGLAVTAVKGLVGEYQRKYGRNIYFVDRQGKITLQGADAGFHVDDIRDMDGLETLADSILSRDTNSLQYSRDGRTYYLNSRYIPEFEWYLCVEQSDEAIVRNIMKTLLVNLLICVVITAVVISLTHATVSAYQRRLERMATTDKLTGLFNRQAFDIVIGQTIRDARRNHASFSLILFDVDNFKRINDTYGHVGGDMVLSHIADITRGRIRDSDVMCRWGGDEFIILLKDCTIDDAHAMAETIRTAVRGNPADHDGAIIDTTISLGMTEYEATDDSLSLIGRADQALYRAKLDGRDRSERASRTG